MQLAVVDDGGEGLLLDGGWSELDALQHARIENVDAGVNAVADELDGLLDETVDAARVSFLMDDDAVLGRLLNLCDDDCALLAMRFMELGQLLERVFADDVAVENEKGRVVLPEDLLRELERSGGAEGFVLDRELDADVVLRLVLLRCGAVNVVIDC